MILLALKIIGIVLLAILGILVLILSVILFVPIRYRLRGSFYESLQAEAGVSWLLHAVSARAVYKQENLVWRIVLFGIFTIYDSSRPPKEKTPKEKKDRKKQSRKKQKISEPKKEPARKQELLPEQKQPEQKLDKGQESKQVHALKQPEKVKEKEADGFFARVKRFLETVCFFLQNIQYTIRRFCAKIKQIVAALEFYIDLLKSEAFINSFILCKKQLSVLWKGIKPRKLRIYVHAGFEDPELLGQILVPYSVLYPWIAEQVIFEADYEKQILEGNFYCKGRITIYRCLKVAWTLYFDKDIRKLIRLFNKEEK